VSLPKMERFDTVDLSLSRTLKNWVGRKKPPAFGKNRLLQAASRGEQPKMSLVSVYLALTLEDNNDLSLYRLKMADVHSLRVCAFGMC
jgi:hypothetical protein